MPSSRTWIQAMNLEQRLETGSVRIPETGCRVWVGGWDKAGYGKIYAGRCMRVHQAAYLLAHGALPVVGVVRHKCDVRACSEPSHLIAGTNKQNTADAVARGRNAKGERHGMSKLTSDLVRQIRSDGRTQKEIALSLNVSRSLVNQVIGRKIWKHL